MPRRVILDTDTGVDDALAILLAMRSPELSVEAITGVCGNIHPWTTAFATFTSRWTYLMSSPHR